MEFHHKKPVAVKSTHKKSDGLSFHFEKNENKVLDPCPIIPEAFRAKEKASLKALDRIGSVKLTLASVSLPAYLGSDGTFTYEDGEMGFSGLNSFELLWHLHQHPLGIPADAKKLLWGLESRLVQDPNYALRCIFFRPYEHKSLADLVDEEFKDMPALVPVDSESYEALLERLEAREKALLAEIKILEEIEQRKARIRDLTNRRDELKSHIDE